ncbi:MAG: flagellar biosynthesis anti-sigma factor FlgM [Dehalococcoidia bacterium]
MGDSRLGAVLLQQERRTTTPLHAVPADGRAARLADLRRRIASGEYQPDPKMIAREILRRGL